MWKFLAVMSAFVAFPIWAGYNGTNTAAWILCGLVLLAIVAKGALLDG